MVPFLEGPALRPGEHDSFFLPMIADKQATLFEPCARGLDQSLSVGDHGLPLIGTGDWNDGMNRVGELGKGESVWLGWFLHSTLTALAPLAEARGEQARAATWRRHADGLREALEREGWDGGGYRRGYFDDGTPLGSAASSECRIDSIAQSWGVISGAADPARATIAMAAVAEHLVRRDDGIVLLFTPPFDQTSLDPGYIKGYPPGIRENGASTRTRHSGPRSPSQRSAMATRRSSCSRCAIPSIAQRHGRRLGATGLSLTPWPPTSTVSRRTSGVADGRGTPDPLPGCTERLSSGSSGSVCEGMSFSSIPVFRKHGPASRSCSDSARRAMRSRSRTPAGSAEASPEPTSTA